jgi:hypothetical protein
MHIRAVTTGDVGALKRMMLFAGFPPDEPPPANHRPAPLDSRADAK